MVREIVGKRPLFRIYHIKQKNSQGGGDSRNGRIMLWANTGHCTPFDEREAKALLLEVFGSCNIASLERKRL